MFGCRICGRIRLPRLGIVASESGFWTYSLEGDLGRPRAHCAMKNEPPPPDSVALCGHGHEEGKC